MSEIAIFQDSRSKAACRSCGAPIEWAETVKNQKRMPFDGEIVVTKTEGRLLVGRVIEYVDTSITPSHFSSCPQAKDWRRNR